MNPFPTHPHTCRYVVLNRPYAFAQWVKKANIPEQYVLMSEPDHIFIRPLPNFMTSDSPAAFPFFYIEPAKAEYQKVTQKFTGPITKKQMGELAPIGNSPTYMVRLGRGRPCTLLLQGLCWAGCLLGGT